MKNIYQGPLRNLTIKEFSLREGNVKVLKYDTAIVKKDLLFYRGLANSFISFDYGTRLLDETEALDVLCTEIATKENPNEGPYPSCLFANPNEIHYKEKVSKQEFKELKKTLRKKGSN